MKNHPAQKERNALARSVILLLVIFALTAAPTVIPNAAPTSAITPYCHLSVSTDTLDLGTVPRPGVFDSPATLTVHVAANIAHGGVMISMADPLEGPEGAKIPLNRTWVKLSAGGQFVDLTAQVTVTGPMNPGVLDVPLKFRVETDFGNPPGTYSGTLVVTLGVAP